MQLQIIKLSKRHVWQKRKGGIKRKDLLQKWIFKEIQTNQKQKQKWDDIVKPNKMQKGQIDLD